MAPVVIMLRIIFWALEAFMRVEPETTSGPTSATMVVSEASASGCAFALQTTEAVFGAACPGVLDGTDDVRRTTAGGDADHDVLAGGAAAGNVTLANLGRVFIDIRGGSECL